MLVIMAHSYVINILVIRKSLKHLKCKVGIVTKLNYNKKSPRLENNYLDVNLKIDSYRYFN